MGTSMGDSIHLNEKEVKTELREMVWKTVYDILNPLLNEEVDAITQSHRYERTESKRIQQKIFLVSFFLIPISVVNQVLR